MDSHNDVTLSKLYIKTNESSYNVFIFVVDPSDIEYVKVHNSGVFHIFIFVKNLFLVSLLLVSQDHGFIELVPHDQDIVGFRVCMSKLITQV